MMAWIGVSVLGVLLSVVGVFLVVSPGVRKFCYGAVCGLGVAGVLLFLFQPSLTPEQTTEQHVGTRVSAQARGTGKETAVSWVPRSSRPGTPGVPTAPERLDAVSTPEEAAQAVQRFRAAQDVQQASEEQPAFAGPQAHVRPPSETLVLHLATPVLTPLRQVTRAAEDNDTVARVAVTTTSAPTMGSALKSCEALKAEIQAKFAAKGLTDYVLTIMTSGDLQGLNIVGSCEGSTRKIVLHRSRNAP